MWGQPELAEAFGDIEWHDAADASVDDGACRVCHSTSTTPSIGENKTTKMITKSKCYYCHCVHMLAFAESTWKEMQ